MVHIVKKVRFKPVIVYEERGAFNQLILISLVRGHKQTKMFWSNDQQLSHPLHQINNNFSKISK